MIIRKAFEKLQKEIMTGGQLILVVGIVDD